MSSEEIDMTKKNTMRTRPKGAEFEPVQLTKDGVKVTARRRSTATQLRSQGWTPVEDAAGARATVKDILEQVDGDPEKAQAALDLEQSNAEPRPSLVAKLRTIVGGDA